MIDRMYNLIENNKSIYPFLTVVILILTVSQIISFIRINDLKNDVYESSQTITDLSSIVFKSKRL